MTPRQKEIAENWGKPVGDTECTCSDFTALPDGNVACLERFMFTVAISVLDDIWSRKQRWCYHNKLEARSAFVDWMENDFEGEPEGYIVAK